MSGLWNNQKAKWEATTHAKQACEWSPREWGRFTESIIPTYSYVDVWQTPATARVRSSACSSAPFSPLKPCTLVNTFDPLTSILIWWELLSFWFWPLLAHRWFVSWNNPVVYFEKWSPQHNHPLGGLLPHRIHPRSARQLNLPRRRIDLAIGPYRP